MPSGGRAVTLLRRTFERVAAQRATSEPSEAELLRRYAEGDPVAARLLTERLLPRVYRLALRLLRDPAEAEDIAQEAMVRLWRAAPQWRAGEAQVFTWLYKVTSNLCLDRLRRARPLPLEEAAEPVDAGPSAEAVLQTEARETALLDALARLPDRQRQAVVLRHLEGLSNLEVAQVLDVSPRAAESLTARGKRALADLLGGRRSELGYDDDTG